MVFINHKNVFFSRKLRNNLEKVYSVDVYGVFTFKK